ncbi:hypothetical protein ACFT9I_24420 [Streptomyces sp. NPDC057137]|uniref:hypothetical protein n=1 Tax=Streptomyces sp. NPDC057137 TaxID=3346030 RepID=UPI00364108C7
MFVDTSGRRSRTFRRFGWAVAIVCACYATTVAASLVGGSSGAPFLRIPGVTDAVAEAAEVKGAGAGAEQPSWEPTIPNGTLPADWGWEEGVVPPSATAAPAEAADAGDGAAAPRETPAGGADTVASGSGSGQNAETETETGSGPDTAPTPPASDVTPPAGDNAGTPPKEPQVEPDPPADEPEGNGNPVDGLLGGLLGLPPLLGG